MDFLTFAMDDDVTERKKREKKAASAECTPLSIDSDRQHGQFKGSSGYYETMLDGCSCVDFARRRHPCKHMYRLAAELGIYQLDGIISDTSKIKLTKREKEAFLENAIRLVDGYPEDTQREMQIALYWWHNGHHHVCDSSKLRPPLNDGLFVTVDDPVAIIKANTQKRTVEGLLSAGFEFPKELKQTKKARYGWCLEHPDIACKIAYPDTIAVQVSDTFEPVALKTYTHLNKKFNPDAYSEEEFSIAIRVK